MSIEEEVETLRRHLDELAGGVDDELMERYELKRPPMPPGLYWRLRWLAGWALRGLKSMPVWRPDPWPVGLKTAAPGWKAKPLLIWAIGVDRDTLRQACDGFLRLRAAWPNFVPVLVTDVVDFAFFSRLGWLVEYLPRLIGEGESYHERKMRFLARLYRDVPAVPVSVGLGTAGGADDIRQWIVRSSSVRGPAGG